MANKRVFETTSEIARIISGNGKTKTELRGSDVCRIIFFKKIVPPRNVKRVTKEIKGGGKRRFLLIKATRENIAAIKAAWEEEQRFHDGSYLNTEELVRELKTYDVVTSSDDITRLTRMGLIQGAVKYGRPWFFELKFVPDIADSIKTIYDNVEKYGRYKGEKL